MRRELKAQLRSIYEAPPPQHKKEFLHKWNQPRMHIGEFLFSQVCYIRKWIWGISAVGFMVPVFGIVVAYRNLVWMISALTPLLAVTVISECGRSENYEMAELEMVTRFSLRSVLFARLWILGAENALLLCLMWAAGIWNGEGEPFQTGVCILIPYLLTALIGLCIMRRFREREAMYFCTGIAAAIGSFVFLSRDMLTRIYRGYDPIWWGCIMLLLSDGVIRQYRNIIAETEEIV
ncbi:MAG: hypothetical protein K2O65_12295 [Lachnospiraceae bacterium]|nr:hypothetical protein [Lachnospiraceae bacterium]